MNIKLQQLKVELKVLAKRIRQNKLALKEYQRQHYGNHGANGIILRKLQWEYRHKHIAYCLLRGRTIDEIEQKTRDDNKRNDELVAKRLAKEAVHELGHVFGIRNCAELECAMYLPKSLRELDKKTDSFCLISQQEFRSAKQAEKPNP